MLCILKIAPKPVGLSDGGIAQEIEVGSQISGWIIATDLDDARRQAQSAGALSLADALYRAYGPTPMLGKHLLPGGYLMLVS